MKETLRQQILVGGIGGQGVLFVTSLLAEAAIQRNLPVFTTETHGMAQRGGTVVSHLKVGDFSSPMIRLGQANALLALKPESVTHHEAFLRPDGWIVVNEKAPARTTHGRSVLYLDADKVARDIGNPKSANLVLLGFALAERPRARKGAQHLFCSLEDMTSVLRERLAEQKEMLEACLRALRAGYCAA